MKTTDIPQAETESMIFGSGADNYSWWITIHHAHAWEHGSAFPFGAPDGWAYDVAADDPHGDGTVRATVTHETIMEAFATIRGGGPRVSKACEAQCRQVAADYGLADFDADTADQVLQVAVFGDVHYG